MKLNLVKVLALFFMVIFLASIANAQGNNGRGKCMEPFGISFYAVKGGYEDEWLELYMKWHYPLMQYALDNGTILQHKLFSCCTMNSTKIILQVLCVRSLLVLAIKILSECLKWMISRRELHYCAVVFQSLALQACRMKAHILFCLDIAL